MAARGNAAPVPAVSKWPKVNQEQRAAILRDNGGLADLCGTSNPRIEDDEQHTEEIIDRLFPRQSAFVLRQIQFHFDTKPREDGGGNCPRWR